VYTDHCELTGRPSAVAALWSYQNRARARDQPSVVTCADGSREYWLERSDPLLNTILPGTGVSVIVNLGDPWSAGRLPPKQFARITRFQSLVHALLSTDVSGWASACSAIGFYDQAHMINEFRAFAGSSPTTFFRPHDGGIDPPAIRLRGRPSEWVRPSLNNQ